MSILQAIAVTLCVGSTIIDREGAEKIRKEENLRLSKLSDYQRYDEKHRNYLKRLSR